MKVLILGAGGNLGQDLVKAFKTSGAEVLAFDRDELDITNSPALRKCILTGDYNAVINAAAWNDLDAMENPDNQLKALALNALAPGVAASACRDSGAMFVHYSSDYVFGGQNKSGYIEDDIPDPISFYGCTKAEGEHLVKQAGGDSYICRLSKIFGRPGISEVAKPSFVSLMLQLAAEKPELKIVNEEVGMPTYTKDIAEATVALLKGEFEPGIYHLVNEGEGVTWYDFAKEFFDLLGVETPHYPVTADDFPRPALRPAYAKLINAKFIKLRPRKEALRDFFMEHPDCVPEKYRIKA